MRALEYHEPTTIADAALVLFDHGKEAQVLAGGIDLIPKMRRGVIQAGHVISIRKIAGLDHIHQDAQGAIVFGAMATLRSIEMSGLVRTAHPILYEAIHQLTSVQTKFMGTAVGNLCVATPASDIATSLMALAAQLKIAGVEGERTEPIDSFYLDYHMTSLKRGEMVAGVFLPAPLPGTGSAFFNLVRTRADIAKLIVAVTVALDEDVCREARIAIGAAAPTPFRAKNSELLLNGQKLDAALIEMAADAAAQAVRPITDIRSTAAYRKDMTRVLVRRALAEAIERAGRKARSATP